MKQTSFNVKSACSSPGLSSLVTSSDPAQQHQNTKVDCGAAATPAADTCQIP